MELTPRTALDPSEDPPRARCRNPWAYAVLAFVVLGVGYVAYEGLTSASLYFYNADEALEQREELGDRRIRVQGVVHNVAVSRDDDRVTFDIVFNDDAIEVAHEGSPPELFEEGTPVVLEGRFARGDVLFLSDEILVKHDEQYEAENEDRIEDAEDGRSGDTEP